MWPLNQIRNCDFKLVIMCLQTPYDDFLTRNPYFQTCNYDFQTRNYDFQTRNYDFHTHV